jgi:DNA primase
MSVNLDKGYFKCWVCDTRGKNVYRIIRKFGDHHQKKEWSALTAQVDYTQLEDIFGESVEVKQVIDLPKEFVSLANRDIPPTGFAARNYLKKRGVTKRDLVWWKLGYCHEGEYEGRIIIPSFDDDGNVNYFVSRSYDRQYYPKYKNPPVSKNIVFNDLFIDWSSDIVLVEGVFDAIKAGRNSIPLLGSTLNDESKLLSRIVKEDSAVYVALDPDAWKKEMRIIETLLKFDIEVWKVDVGDYEDVGAMPTETFQRAKQNAKKIDFDNFLVASLKNL